jgi:hypothetical protein
MNRQSALDRTDPSIGAGKKQGYRMFLASQSLEQRLI